MTKVILVSQNPLPYHDIGSWTTMYKNYFESDNVFIDTIVCEEPKSRFKNVEYCIVPNTITTKLKKKLKKKPHQNYVDALLEHLKPNETYVIQIVDNFGLGGMHSLTKFTSRSLKLIFYCNPPGGSTAAHRFFTLANVIE